MPVSHPKHWIIDGANVLHAWSDLRQLAARDRAVARAELVRRMTSIHDSGDVRVTLVFDGRGSEMVMERPFEQTTFSVVYTPSSLTADDAIEQLVANSSDPSACCVVTDDHAERETVLALGAAVLRTADLAVMIEQAVNRQSVRVQQRQQENNQHWKARG